LAWCSPAFHYNLFVAVILSLSKAQQKGFSFQSGFLNERLFLPNCITASDLTAAKISWSLLKQKTANFRRRF